MNTPSYKFLVTQRNSELLEPEVVDERVGEIVDEARNKSADSESEDVINVMVVDDYVAKGTSLQSIDQAFAKLEGVKRSFFTFYGKLPKGNELSSALISATDTNDIDWYSGFNYRYHGSPIGTESDRAPYTAMRERVMRVKKEPGQKYVTRSINKPNKQTNLVRQVVTEQAQRFLSKKESEEK